MGILRKLIIGSAVTAGVLWGTYVGGNSLLSSTNVSDDGSRMVVYESRLPFEFTTYVCDTKGDALEVVTPFKGTVGVVDADRDSKPDAMFVFDAEGVLRKMYYRKDPEDAKEFDNIQKFWDSYRDKMGIEEKIQRYLREELRL